MALGSTIVTCAVKDPFLDMTKLLITTLAGGNLVEDEKQQLADKLLLSL
jgi:hypothetical protein